MPNHKHHKSRGRDVDNIVINNRNCNVAENGHAPPREAAEANGGQHFYECCIPTGCKTSEEAIDSNDPYDAVKVFCNNENCSVGKWMHKDCFEEWELSVLAYLRSCGRARSWSEKQRLQNLWTKKGYDLAFKACDCKCGKGHLRKDLDYIPKLAARVEDVKKQKKHKKKNDKPMPVMSTSQKTPNSTAHMLTTAHTTGTVNYNYINNNVYNANVNTTTKTSPDGSKSGSTLSINTTTRDDNGNHTVRDDNGNSTDSSVSMLLTTQNGNPQRQRTGSASSHSSTGSSPPNSATSGSPLSTSPVNGNCFFKQVKKLEYLADSTSAAGNIFKRRLDYSAFDILPRFKQNPYNIKMEDEGPHGNDDTRSFVLSTLSSYKMTSLKCIICKCHLPVFDHYPLIDGTFFLSPRAYDECVVQVIWEGRIQFLNSICVGCLEGRTDIKCCACKQKWDGSSFVLGTMYTYDIFAAMPCCQKRLTCKYCRRAVVDVTSGLNFFSQYSQMIICPYCNANDYHFIRSLGETFIVKPICY
ncbi:headcase protein-like [Gigantopelta aegis]|uniref:headcase protein-like n=1 Tax=Gigantopelta aegis TaxID=1735272 RepID=UPI001B88B82C|nr:headcase protein-like [Gigantopelta aegis]